MIVEDWENAQQCYPPIKKAEIAAKYGVDRDTVRGIINNAEAVKKRAAFFSSVVLKEIKEIAPKKHGVVMAIPDLHCPFHHEDALEFLKAVRDKYQPQTVVCLGDEIDAHALSRYPKDPNGMSAGQEISAAREALYPFYREFPNVLVCESNHTVRGHKLAFEAGIPQAFLSHISTILNAPEGWKWANKHLVDGVLYIHGDAGRSGQYAHIHYVKAFKKSVVIGHIHSYAGVNYEGHLFGMNAGCLIDTSKYCFAYAKNMPIEVNLGCGVVMGGQTAQFIPMRLKDGRWTGEL